MTVVDRDSDLIGVHRMFISLMEPTTDAWVTSFMLTSCHGVLSFRESKVGAHSSTITEQVEFLQAALSS